MQKLDKGENITAIDFDFGEGERTLLSSNESGVRSPSLDFLDTSSEEVSEDMILQNLARIISDIYLKKRCLPNKIIKQ